MPTPLRTLAAHLAIIPPLALAQSTAPSDPTLDWLMSQSTSAPASAPADPPATQSTPFAPRGEADARPARLTLSDGKTVTGRFTTTRDKPVRVWDEAEKQYRDIPFKLIRSFEAKILWERDQPEWRFKDSGSDVKEFTGKTYPAREMLYVVTLVNGQTVTGGIVCPLYNEDQTLYVLNKRSKGEVGQSLDGLVFVKRVEFDAPAATRPATSSE